MLPAKKSACGADNDVFSLYESKVQSYARVFPQIFTRALGSEMWDASGRRYLDFLSGAGSLNYGHNNPVLKQALIDYIVQDGITHSLDLHTGAKAKFLEAMQEIVLKPRGLDYVVQFTGPTGTNSVEAALKIARKATGRTNIIYFTNGFHGVSLGALSVTGNEFYRRAAGVPLPNAISMPYEGDLGADVDTIDHLDRALSGPAGGAELPAAVILEVVQGEGGLNALSMQWLKRLDKLCHEKGILLIVDDIQAGCGRTGSFFSFEPAGIKPDIVTLSKSLSGYGLPCAVVLFKRALDLWEPGQHNGTFRGNNHAFITAAAMLNHYWRSTAFAKGVVEKGIHLGNRLQRLVDCFSPHLLEVRGRGMMIGVVCDDPKRAAAITSKAFERGLVIERSGAKDEVIKCMMPLTTSYPELDEGVDILARVIAEELGVRTLRSRKTASTHSEHDFELQV